MSRWLIGCFSGAILIAAAALLSGCKEQSLRPLQEPPPSEIRPTDIDYVDADGFDSLFESALANRDPVIVIHTTFEKPEWGARLNAWIAAWNAGGSVTAGRTARGQIPGVTINGESIREFRLLVDDLMNRVESAARTSSTWWAEDRVRSRRVTLLKPYNLRFHMDEEKKIRLIFFNGDYASSYKGYMESVTHLECQEEWCRNFECSECRQKNEAANKVDRVTSRQSLQPESR
jgi:hypothetical protein